MFGINCLYTTRVIIGRENSIIFLVIKLANIVTVFVYTPIDLIIILTRLAIDR